MSPKPMYLKISVYNFYKNSRDARELHVAEESGFENIVILSACGQDKKYLPRNWTFYGVNLEKFGQTGIKKVFSKIYSLVSFILKTRKLKPQYISGHDVLGMTIGYVGSIGRRNRTTMIYDAHEYELGRFTTKPRTKIVKKLLAFWEKFLIKKSELSIIVNDSIAAQMQEDYQIDFNHVVVRNIPDAKTIDRQKSRQVRNDWLKMLGIEDNDKILIYHGVIQKGRGIEKGLEICANLKDHKLGFVILGYGHDSYLDKLKKKAQELGISRRVLFQSAVSGEDLLSYVAAADIGLVMIEPVSKSYYFALPNKLFENIYAGNPILGSNLPEIKKIVERHHIGLTCDISNVEQASTCLKAILEENSYKDFVHNIYEIKELYRWENEAILLKEKLEGIK